MFETGQFIVYGSTGVCKVDGIESMKPPGSENLKLYYTLEPVYNQKNKVYTPVDNEKIVMRPVISMAEANSLMEEIPDLDVIAIQNEKERERVYRAFIHSCDVRKWGQIIRTVYDRRTKRLAIGKKVTSNDAKYLHMAEDILFGELSVVIGIPRLELKGAVTEKVKQMDQTIAENDDLKVAAGK